MGRVLVFATLLLMSGVAAMGQAPPGPLEVLPFEEGFIQEAWYDLYQQNSLRADWTGWEGTTWVSPNAYNGHQGSDFSVQTGTPVFAAADGTVTTVVTNIPANTGSGYGNYVRITLDNPGPRGEALTIITAHMLPSVVVTVGQRVTTGQLLGYSDNTGNSTSEHVHMETALASGATRCPFYYGLCKYPIMFAANTRTQIGHIVRITAEQTSVRADRYSTSPVITTVSKGQLYFATYWQRGYYRIFIPDDASNRSGWISALDAQEVFDEGTVIQALPDTDVYTHNDTLDIFYAIHEDPTTESMELGFIVYAGGRFVADEEQNGWYRIPVPGGGQWGWVKPDSMMVVYPERYNPAVEIELLARNEFPIREDFEELGRSLFGRAKYNRGVVQSFSPAAPTNADGKALWLTTTTNNGDGTIESVVVGRPEHRNYFVQSDVYFVSRPTAGGWDRYGVFLRDDGFGGMDDTFEGPGNCYAMLYDTDDGRLRCGRLDGATPVDLMPSALYRPDNAWHTMRIEAEETTIRYYLDGELLLEVTDDVYASGPCGLGVSNHRTTSSPTPGAYFDNFRAGLLTPPILTEGWGIY